MKRLIRSREAHALHQRWFLEPIPSLNNALTLQALRLVRHDWHRRVNLPGAIDRWCAWRINAHEHHVDAGERLQHRRRSDYGLRRCAVHSLGALRLERRARHIEETNLLDLPPARHATVAGPKFGRQCGPRLPTWRSSSPLLSPYSRHGRREELFLRRRSYAARHLSNGPILMDRPDVARSCCTTPPQRTVGSLCIFWWCPNAPRATPR